MTPKQELRSITKKMERLQKNNIEIDMKSASRRFLDIKKYYELDRAKFFLEFNLNHCEKCGKKL